MLKSKIELLKLPYSIFIFTAVIHTLQFNDCKTRLPLSPYSCSFFSFIVPYSYSHSYLYVAIVVHNFTYTILISILFFLCSSYLFHFFGTFDIFFAFSILFSLPPLLFINLLSFLSLLFFSILFSFSILFFSLTLFLFSLPLLLSFVIKVLDLNNDGFDDLLVSSPFERHSNEFGQFGGAVRVYYSQVDNSLLLLLLLAQQDNPFKAT